MFDEIKTLLVEKPLSCPSCDHELKIGDTMYKDEYRNEVICCYCLEDYKKVVLSEEGIDGIYLR